MLIPSYRHCSGLIRRLGATLDMTVPVVVLSITIVLSIAGVARDIFGLLRLHHDTSMSVKHMLP